MIPILTYPEIKFLFCNEQNQAKLLKSCKTPNNKKTKPAPPLYLFFYCSGYIFEKIQITKTDLERERERRDKGT